MAALGTSRMTVHRALVTLAEEGLVRRRRRIGTIVVPPPIRHPVMTIPDIQDAIAATGSVHRTELVTRMYHPSGAPALRAKFGPICDRAVLHLICRHFAGEAPFVIEDRVIAVEAAPGALDQDFGNHPPGSWLLATIPWTDAEHEISAIELDAMAARLLHVATRRPALQVMRRTWNAQRFVTVVSLVYPGTSHVFIGRFTAYGQKPRGDESA